MTGSSRLAGLLLFIGATEFLVGMIVAEALYPGYNVALNYISDLGATCRSGSCLISQPTSLIFNGSAIFLGLLTIISSFLLWRAYKNKVLVPIVTLAGIGVLGVGLFPETAQYNLHSIFSFIAFFFAGVSAIAAYKVENKPFSYLSVIMGLFTLAALGLYVNQQYAGLGPGGMERMIAYPALIFATAFGAHLMGKTEQPPITPPSK